MPTPTKYPSFWNVKVPFWLGLLAALLYAQSLTYDYALDDSIVLSENYFTQQGIKGIPGIWKHDTFYGFFQDSEKAKLVSGGRYRPLSLTLFAIEGEIFGFQPWVGHLFNCIYYGLLAMMMYVVLFRLLSGIHKYGQRIALWTTLFFVSHPLHSEVVANIKGRDEILAFLGGLACIWILQKGKGLLQLSLVFLLFSIALFSKENALVFLPLIPMLFYLIKDRKKALRSLIPLSLAALLYFVVRTIIIGLPLGGEAPAELLNNPFMEWRNGAYHPLGYWERMPTVFLSLLKYLKLFIIPWPLTHDYYPLQIPLVGFGNPWALLSFLIYVSASAAAIYTFIVRRSISAFGWLWFVIALLPMSNILINVGTLMSERFMFIPSFGLCLLLSLFIFEIGPSSKRATYVKNAMAISLTGVFLLLTLIRTPVWSTNYSLFTRDVITSAESAKAQNAAGGSYNERAGQAFDFQEQSKWADKAIPHLQKAIELHPTYKNAFLQLGNSYFYKRNFEKAIEHYNRALALDPDYQDALNNLGLAYREAGQYYGEEKQDIEKALRYLKQAYELRPGDYETIRLMGVAHGVAGQAEKAAQFFRKAYRMKPDNHQANYNLGVALIQLGKLDSGQIYIEMAKRLDDN